MPEDNASRGGPVAQPAEDGEQDEAPHLGSQRHLQERFAIENTGVHALLTFSSPMATRHRCPNYQAALAGRASAERLVRRTIICHSLIQSLGTP